MGKAIRTQGLILGASLVSFGSASVYAQARKPIALVTKSANCALEFKPMSKPKAPWKPYRKTLPAGSRVQGFASDLNYPDVYSFRAANPKDFFFRGSLACLSGKLPEKSRRTAPAKKTSTYTGTYDDSGTIFGVSYWKSALVMDAVSPAASNEDIASTNFAGNFGYNFQFYRNNSSSVGAQVYLTAGLSLVENATSNYAIEFSGNAIIGGLVIKPTYYFDTGFVEVGPLAQLSLLYGLYDDTDLGVIDKPFEILPVFGLSLKAPGHGHTLDLGFKNFSFSKIFIALNLAL